MQQKIPQLDAIRGVAVLLVIMNHVSGKYPSLQLQGIFGRGWMGVDLFFVLSGFLITKILLSAKDSDGYFKNFYARRCLRIWPLYYSVLILMFVVIPFLRPSEAAKVFEARSSPWWAYPLFLQNFLIPSPPAATGPLGVTWSLAIEEQFYLVWPLVVRYCSYRQLRTIALTVFCVSPALRLYLSHHNVLIYSNFFCRLDGLMAGALLALLLSSQSLVPAKYIRLAWVSLVFAAAIALLADSVQAMWIVFTFTSLSAVSLVYLALFSKQEWLQAALKNRFIVYTGMISYGLYLLHKIPFDMAQSLHLDRHPAIALPIGLSGGFVLAIASWTLLEKPFLNLKRFFVMAALQPGAASPFLAVGPEGASEIPLAGSLPLGRS
jgi:peptidoglycan/LPS O-acetylase OafA/YrhL